MTIVMEVITKTDGTHPKDTLVEVNQLLKEGWGLVDVKTTPFSDRVLTLYILEKKELSPSKKSAIEAAENLNKQQTLGNYQIGTGLWKTNFN